MGCWWQLWRSLLRCLLKWGLALCFGSLWMPMGSQGRYWGCRIAIIYYHKVHINQNFSVHHECTSAYKLETSWCVANGLLVSVWFILVKLCRSDLFKIQNSHVQNWFMSSAQVQRRECLIMHSIKVLSCLERLPILAIRGLLGNMQTSHNERQEKWKDFFWSFKLIRN